ncbi:MAG: transposase [Pseudomonadales bacterium]|nr:transposase [Pseudomonadales bacterium]
MTHNIPVGAHGRAPLHLHDEAPVPQDGAAPLRNRRSIRLRGHDYSQAGAYFVTLCTFNRECLFGEIVDGGIRLNDGGWIVADEWAKTAEIRDEIELDSWVVMPNHLHGIVVITDPVGAHGRAPLRKYVNLL